MPRAKEKSPGVSTLTILLVTIIGIAWAIGNATAPDAWYANLQKPPLNPPGYVFGIVWPILYAMMTVAYWRVLRTNRANNTTHLIFWGQLLVNYLWSPIFFSGHQIALGFFWILLLIALVATMLLHFYKRDRMAGYLLMPYVAWLCFAAYLNGGIWWLNR